MKEKNTFRLFILLLVLASAGCRKENVSSAQQVNQEAIQRDFRSRLIMSVKQSGHQADSAGLRIQKVLVMTHAEN